jgi:membrane-associated protease RseP (regulator of RpoE activity)
LQEPSGGFFLPFLHCLDSYPEDTYIGVNFVSETNRWNRRIVEDQYQAVQEPEEPLGTRVRAYLVHISLVVVSFFTATVAGVQWLNKDPFELSNFWSGALYALLILGMLASHEFGHYFAARHHGVKATLPFFIPFPSYFGTLGAVIKIRSAIPSRKVMFDIGAAGPISGFIVSLLILIAGFLTLPPIEYLYSIHPEYAQLAAIPTGGLTFGNTLLYSGIASVFAPPEAFVPPMNEIYHYPFLCVGWFGLFVTAMNLIPIGQLDGGHISHSMFGRLYHPIAQISLGLLVLLGAAGFLPVVGIDLGFGWSGWLFWALVLIGFMKIFKLNRPPIEDEEPLDPARMVVGWMCVGIFFTSFALTPFSGF